MICEFCYGLGYTLGPEDDEGWQQMNFCSECWGMRVVSCCEGSERHGQIGPGDEDATKE